MRLRRYAVVVGVLGGLALATAPGCLDATQMTVEISLAKRAQCTEIHGAAITVGVDPAETEARVRDEYVSAATQSCDPATRSIGSLVLTPSDSGTASIVVVVAYDQVAPSSCKPPLYKGCIVARRRFSFSKHRGLTMPITIDPDCKDVPCDAFSTCRTGVCFRSDIGCTGDLCTEPGATPDGGTSEAGVVIPDAGLPDGTLPDGALPDGALPDGALPDGAPGDGGPIIDGGPDASLVDGGPLTGAVCLGLPSKLRCGGGACQGGQSCCGLSSAVAVCQAAICNESQFCCNDSDCPVGKPTCGNAVVAKNFSRVLVGPGMIGTCQ